MSGEKFIPLTGMENKALQRPFNQQLDQLEAPTVFHDNTELLMSMSSGEFSHHSGTEKRVNNSATCGPQF
jgi:hypothetical protein